MTPLLVYLLSDFSTVFYYSNSVTGMLRIARLAIVAITALVAWTFTLSLDVQSSTKLFILLVGILM